MATTPSALETSEPRQAEPYQPELRDKFVHTLCESFRGIPFNDWFVMVDEKLQDRAELTDEILHRHFLRAVEHYEEPPHNHIMKHVNDCAAVAIFMLDRTKDDHVHPFRDASDALHKKHNLMDAYSLKIICRDPTRPKSDTKGAVRALLEAAQAMGRRDQKKVTLEAITDTARGVYEYFGWRVVEKGEVGSEKHPYWLMVWEAPKL